MAEQEIATDMLVYMGFGCEFCEGKGYTVREHLAAVCCGSVMDDGSCCGEGIPHVDYQQEQCMSCLGQRTIEGRT